MDAEEPALALDSVKRRVPFDCLAHAGDGAHDERVEAAPDVPFPAPHVRDVGLRGASPPAFFAAFVDLMDVLLAIAFTPLSDARLVR
jgi:hypothetical protein